MYWARNLELLKGSASAYLHEFEVASEKFVTRLCSYEDGAIRIYQLAPPNLEGLAKYMIEVRVPQSQFDPEQEAKEPTKRGYIARKGILGELLGILSLHFEARFFPLSSSLRLSETAMQLRTYHDFHYHPCSHDIDQPIFKDSDRTFVEPGFQDLLNKIRRLPSKHHVAFGFAFEHYARALQEIGVDEEMIFIRLVSAVEALSQKINVTEKDVLYGKTFEELVDRKKLDKSEYDSLRSTFNVRKSEARFRKFLALYSSDFFDDSVEKAQAVSVPRARLDEVAAAIYHARSKYLHNGDPMYLSLRIGGHWPDWDIDPSGGMIVGGRRWTKKQKLPYPHWFRRLVRHCILRYLDEVTAPSAESQPSKKTTRKATRGRSARSRNSHK